MTLSLQNDTIALCVQGKCISFSLSQTDMQRQWRKVGTLPLSRLLPSPDSDIPDLPFGYVSTPVAARGGEGLIIALKSVTCF